MSFTASIFSQIFSVLSLFFIITLSIIVLKNSRNLANKLFFLLTLILDVWIIGSFMLISSHTDEQIIFWDRFIYAAVVFWPALQYHFSLAVTYINEKRRYLLYTAYGISFSFLYFSQTDIFASGVFHYAWGAHTKANFLHHVFIVLFSAYIFIFLYSLIKKYKTETNILEKKRILYYILGFSVLDFIGGTAFLPAYSIPFYPLFLATPLMFSIIITYSIVYFGLMNIKLIMRRYVVYFFSLLTVILPAYLLIFNIYILYPKHLTLSFLLVTTLAITIFPHVKNYLYKFSNQYLFSSLYDSGELIYNLNTSLRSSLDITQIFKSTTEILMKAFHSRAISILYYEQQSNLWTILYNNGFDFKANKINVDYKAVCRLFINNKPFKLSTLKGKQPNRTNARIIKFFKDLNAELIVPIIEQKQVRSIIVFSSKESGESYNNRDLKVLESVAVEIGISLENALLYQSVTKFNIKLKDEIFKATKKLKEQNEALKQLDIAKTEFIGIASHQLRTPLTGIRWLAELLLKNKDNNLNEKQLGFLNQLVASNQRMIRLVNDLLDVSHIETGRKFDIIKQEFPVDPVIQEVLKENIFLITTKNLKITNKIPENTVIFGDRDKVKQVILNLISNATKYTNSDTEIIISLEKEQGNQIFCVQDQGMGIPKDQQKKIFTKFFRASNASLQHSDGTGLGLYIAREIMRVHGGDVWFSSNEKGTNFYFSIPEANKEAKVNLLIENKNKIKNKKYA